MPRRKWEVEKELAAAALDWGKMCPRTKQWLNGEGRQRSENEERHRGTFWKSAVCQAEKCHAFFSFQQKKYHVFSPTSLAHFQAGRVQV